MQEVIVALVLAAAWGGAVWIVCENMGKIVAFFEKVKRRFKNGKL